MTTWYAQPLSIGWKLVVAETPPNYQEWRSPTTWNEDTPDAWVPTQPPNLMVPVGTSIEFVVEVSGIGIQGTFFGSVTKGALSITSVTGMTDVAVGQLLEAGGVIPDGSRIVSIVGTTITFGNGEFDEVTNVYVDPQGALMDYPGSVFGTTEDRPLGMVAAVISPDTGITVTDVNADGTGNTSHTGDGNTIANLVGLGGGDFTVVFADAGTYTVGATFTPAAGSNFVSASVAPITVTVT